MQIGDLVILNTNKPALVMQVIGDYFFQDGEYPPYYQNRRKAHAVQVDPNLLWQRSGRAAKGQSIYSTLVRCANRLDNAEYEALCNK